MVEDGTDAAELGAQAAGGKPQQHRGVWVVAEHRDGKPEDFCYPVVAEGKSLADKLGQDLSVVLLGISVKHMAQCFSPYGADRVLAIEDQHLEKYSSYGFVDVMARLAALYQPSLASFLQLP